MELTEKTNTLNYFIKICNSHKYMGQAYVYIEDKLREYSQTSSLNKMLVLFNNIAFKSPAFQEAAKAAFIKAYNKDLALFLNYICDEKEKEDLFNRYSITLFEELGRNFSFSMDKVYKLRRLNKEDLAKFNGLKIPTKYTKNIISK